MQYHDALAAAELPVADNGAIAEGSVLAKSGEGALTNRSPRCRAVHRFDASGLAGAPLGVRLRPLLDLLGLIWVQDLPERLPADSELLCCLGRPDRLTKASGELASFCGDSGDGRAVLRGLAGKARSSFTTRSISLSSMTRWYA